MNDWGSVIDAGVNTVLTKDAAYRSEIADHENKRLAHRQMMNGIIGRQAGPNALLRDEVVRIATALNPANPSAALERLNNFVDARKSELEKSFWNDVKGAEAHIHRVTS